MRIRPSIVAALAAATILSGCTSYRGANRLHDTTNTSKKPRVAPAYQFYGVRQMFINDLTILMN